MGRMGRVARAADGSAGAKQSLRLACGAGAMGMENEPRSPRSVEMINELNLNHAVESPGLRTRISEVCAGDCMCRHCSPFGFCSQLSSLNSQLNGYG
jgi:hypothetical protein